MQVVQTPSPWAIVARRCTWRPSIRLIAAVSASHSWGNSWATWETGQCCWHSCSPTGTSRTAAAYPSSVKTLRERLRPARGRGAASETTRKRCSILAARRSAKLAHGRVARRSRRGSAWPARRGRRRPGRDWSRPASVSANTFAGRPRPRARGQPRLAGHEGALVDQLVEVAAYGGRGQREALGEGRGRRGTVDHDRPHDALARRLVVPDSSGWPSISTTPVCP